METTVGQVSCAGNQLSPYRQALEKAISEKRRYKVGEDENTDDAHEECYRGQCEDIISNIPKDQLAAGM
jgi:hypothetical protein